MSFKVREFFQRAERFNLNDRQMKFLKKILNEDRGRQDYSKEVRSNYWLSS